MWPRTWTCAWARFSTGPNGDSRSAECYTHPLAPPGIILPSSSPPPPPSHAHLRLPTSRGMMMRFPVKGHSLRRVHQLPVTKGTDPQSLLPRRGKELFQHPAAQSPRLAAGPGTSSMHCTCRGRVYLVGGDILEDVARTPVLAPPDPTDTLAPLTSPSPSRPPPSPFSTQPPSPHSPCPISSA